MTPGAVRAVRVEGILDRGSLAGGEFEIVAEPGGQRRFMFCCPGCRTVSALAVRPVPAPRDPPEPSWELSGTAEAPTLHPSVHHVGCWHGWIRAGVCSLA